MPSIGGRRVMVSGRGRGMAIARYWAGTSHHCRLSRPSSGSGDLARGHILGASPAWSAFLREIKLLAPKENDLSRFDIELSLAFLTSARST